jgi:hypothetical protein
METGKMKKNMRGNNKPYFDTFQRKKMKGSPSCGVGDRFDPRKMGGVNF